MAVPVDSICQRHSKVQEAQGHYRQGHQDVSVPLLPFAAIEGLVDLVCQDRDSPEANEHQQVLVSWLAVAVDWHVVVFPPDGFLVGLQPVVAGDQC